MEMPCKIHAFSQRYCDSANLSSCLSYLPLVQKVLREEGNYLRWNQRFFSLWKGYSSRLRVWTSERTHPEQRREKGTCSGTGQPNWAWCTWGWPATATVLHFLTRARSTQLSYAGERLKQDFLAKSSCPQTWHQCYRFHSLSEAIYYNYIVRDIR